MPTKMPTLSEQRPRATVRPGAPHQAPALQPTSAEFAMGLHLAVQSPGAVTSTAIQHLQRTIGNGAISRLLAQTGRTATTPRPVPIQAKLLIGPTGDTYEQEADRVAAQVVNQIHAPVATQAAPGLPVQRQDEVVAGGKASSAFAAAITRARSGGQPLATNLQGAYAPGSREGQGLIAHELTHVVQQTGTNAGPITRYVQRRPWLDNADQRIYKDNDVVEELTFIGTSGGKKNVGNFIPYGKLDELKAWAENVKKDRLSVDPKSLATLTFTISQNFKNWYDELRKTIDKLYTEDDQQDLKEVTGLLTMPTIKLLLDAANDGPLLRREGGGSRLPPAVGKLYIDRTFYSDKNNLLLSLGVKPNDLGRYKRVQEMLCDSTVQMRDLQANEWNGSDQVIEESGYIYVSSAVARPSVNRRVTANGKNYAADFSDIGGDAVALANSFNSMKAPQNTDWVSNLSGGRDATDQISVMDKWNALGAVAYHNAFRANNGRPVDINQNFEWLHIRGAQIGGHTTQGNLAAGTFSANSAMIPYEKLIKNWHKANFGKIFARFSTQLRDHVLAEEIKIEIYTDKHPELGTIDKSTPLELKFYPLTGKVVDKLIGKLHIKRTQEKIKQQQNQPPLDRLLNPSIIRNPALSILPDHLQQGLEEQHTLRPPQPLPLNVNAPQLGALVPLQGQDTQNMPLLPLHSQTVGDLSILSTHETTTFEFTVPITAILNQIDQQGGYSNFLQNMQHFLQQSNASLEVTGPGINMQLEPTGISGQPGITHRQRIGSTNSTMSQQLTTGKRSREDEEGNEEERRVRFKLTVPNQLKNQMAIDTTTLSQQDLLPSSDTELEDETEHE